VDASDYVNRLAQEVGATVTAYLLTDPAAQTVLGVSRSIAETVAPLWPAVQAAFMVHDVVGFTLDATAAPVGLLDVGTDLARSVAEVGGILPSFDQAVNMGLPAMQTYNDLIDATADMVRPELIAESAPPFSTSMEEPVLTEADEKLQAEWKETARADQQQREQAQREADNRVVDQLEAALQKDAALEVVEPEVAEPEVVEPEVVEQARQDERSLEIQRECDAMEQAIAARRAALESKEMEL
jgi:hypothetical protein